MTTENSQTKKTIKHVFTSDIFELSTDYALLFEIISTNNKNRVPAWIIYNDEHELPIWDLVEVKQMFLSSKDFFRFFIGTRGRDYSCPEHTFEWFEHICTSLSLHFIVPQNAIGEKSTD